jgi:hypothetical protein
MISHRLNTNSHSFIHSLFSLDAHFQLVESLGGHVVHGRPYKPRTQRVIERFNQKIKEHIARAITAANDNSRMNGKHTLATIQILSYFFVKDSDKINLS